MCKQCNSQMCFEDKSNLAKFKCSLCHTQCKNKKCLRVHNETFCVKKRTCLKCDGVKQINSKHVCKGEVFCKNCKIAVNSNHKCYVLTQEQAEKRDKKKSKKVFDAGYIFFDYETYVDNEKNHVPNLIMAKKVCKDCLEKDESEYCAQCSEIYTFTSNKLFCKWLISNKNYIAMAHNLKGFDSVFLIQYFINAMLPTDEWPSLIVNGSKTISITFRDLKIIDSYSFIPNALETFPKTFGIKELKKGFFPHKFNIPENELYEGEYPAESFYQPEYFSPKKYAEFKEWYSENKSKKFKMHHEIREYCLSDVMLLTKGMLQFRKDVIQSTKTEKNKTGIDPFQVAITIASLCNFIWRNKCLKPETVAIIPEKGYNAEQKTSFNCQYWLKYLSIKHKIDIQHAKNKGEFKIKNHFVDGYDPVNKTCYEMHGCFYHGCPKCYGKKVWNPLKNETFSTTFSKHQKRIESLTKFIVDHNMKLIEIWECEFNWLAKNDSILKELIKNGSIKPRLNPRDALFGGRTNAFVLYYKVKVGEKIKYYDFCSLYPYIQKYGVFPIGHPVLITENFESIDKYFGLVKCKVLPPKKLYAPVLPARCDNKLVFSLCNKCSIQKKVKCEHLNHERALEGTWVTLEINKAVEVGYKILEIYEIWHWVETTQYNRHTNPDGGLFVEYINDAVKRKLEASGYPPNCTTSEQKQKYIELIYQKEAILLDPSKIEFNAGKRAWAKLMANSQWGYLAMNLQTKKTHKFVKDPVEWFEMVNNDLIQIENVDYFYRESSKSYVLQVYYMKIEEVNFGNFNTNVVLAAFVTAQARLKLYSEIEKLGERVLYFDTDSIIFISKENEYEPSTGEFLGDLTNEIDPKDGDHIVEFVSAGPKNYAFKTNSGFIKTTIKGFTLNKVASTKIDFDKMKEIVLNDQSAKVEIPQLLFKRDKKQWQISMHEVKKLYGFVYTKRALILNNLNEAYINTLPFGYF